jgi:alpha-beta hydrolase superfamily lysophospholipase
MTAETSRRGSSVGHDGLSLATRTWAPDASSGEPWAYVLLVHGLAEHAGRYEHVGRRMADAGLHVHAYDHRGHGGSAGRRVHVDRWAELRADLSSELSRLREAAGPLPVVLYGHSLGGLVALGYALSDRPRPDLLVLSAPALDSAFPFWKRVVAAALSRATPRLRVRNGFDGSVLSRDPGVGERYLADPLNNHWTTARFGGEGFAEQRRVRARLGELSVPTLVIHGADDRLVPPSASAPLASIPGVTRRVLPGLRHESHNEPEWADVVDGIVDWLRSEVGRMASAVPDVQFTPIEYASGERITR